jgi:hypothetical protein
LGISLRQSARSGRGLYKVEEVTPRPRLYCCSCNNTAARISGIQTCTITSINCRRRHNKEVDRSRIERKAAKKYTVGRKVLQEEEFGFGGFEGS